MKFEAYQDTSKKNRVNKFRNIRGPYQSYAREVKKKAVMLLDNGVSLTRISKVMGIPCKNIKRWHDYGVDRKKGAGRKKTDPVMEENVCGWIYRNHHPGEDLDPCQLQQVALHFSTDPNFKASKGWLGNFLDRYQLRS